MGVSNRFFILVFFICTFLVSTQTAFSIGPDSSFDVKIKKKSFINLSEIDPTIIIDMRYFGVDNFVGKRIDGYKANICYLTIDAAAALVEVQGVLKTDPTYKKKNLSLKVFDCYRPQKAVDHFVRWSKSKDTKNQEEFYPGIPKTKLFPTYIATKSGHSRGSTVDLTIVSADNPEEPEEIRMGTIFDFFNPLTRTENPDVEAKKLENRRQLKKLMERFGFKKLFSRMVALYSKT